MAREFPESVIGLHIRGPWQVMRAPGASATTRCSCCPSFALITQRARCCSRSEEGEWCALHNPRPTEREREKRQRMATNGTFRPGGRVHPSTREGRQSFSRRNLRPGPGLCCANEVTPCLCTFRCDNDWKVRSCGGPSSGTGPRAGEVSGQCLTARCRHRLLGCLVPFIAYSLGPLGAQNAFWQDGLVDSPNSWPTVPTAARRVRVG